MNCLHAEALAAEVLRLRSERDEAILHSGMRNGGFWGRAAAREIEKRKRAEAILLESTINVEAMRENLHATFNGGHQTPETIRAFHHGMDTVCNVLEAHQKREGTNGIL